MEDWLDRGLNRHIEIYNPALDEVFEGFVNQVSYSAGTLSAVRGPLMSIANRVSVTYTPILDATTVPPIEGTQWTTTIADDTDSQDKFAIVEKVVSGGRLLDDGTTDQAAQMRDTYLEEYREPETTEDVSFGSTSEPTVQLEILGYVHRFAGYVYQDLTAATIQLDTKMQAVITADPNGLFSTDYTDIDANASLVSRYENDNRSGWDVIQELVATGDAAFNRYTFGVYGDRKSVYAAVPTDVAYDHMISGENIIITVHGTESIDVKPWDILPARWMFLQDFLVGKGGVPADLKLDPRFMFIESVRYTAPYQLDISGNKVRKISQMMAQRGL
jgi:hypothetical protein